MNYPPELEPHFDTDEKAIAVMRERLGIPDFEPKVHVITRWRLEGLVAPTTKVGRVFLLGDAAHRHPPTGGLGLTSAVHDVHNLCWKLAHVLRERAGEALLDTLSPRAIPRLRAQRPALGRERAQPPAARRNARRHGEQHPRAEPAQRAPALAGRSRGRRAPRPGGARDCQSVDGVQGAQRRVRLPRRIRGRDPRRQRRAGQRRRHPRLSAGHAPRLAASARVGRARGCPHAAATGRAALGVHARSPGEDGEAWCEAARARRGRTRHRSRRRSRRAPRRGLARPAARLPAGPPSSARAGAILVRPDRVDRVALDGRRRRSPARARQRWTGCSPEHRDELAGLDAHALAVHAGTSNMLSRLDVHHHLLPPAFLRAFAALVTVGATVWARASGDARGLAVGAALLRADRRAHSAQCSH